MFPFKFIEPVSVFVVLIDSFSETIPILRTSAPDMPRHCWVPGCSPVVEISLVLLLKIRSFVACGLFPCLVESIAMHPQFYFCLNSIACQVIIVIVGIVGAQCKTTGTGIMSLIVFDIFPTFSSIQTMLQYSATPWKKSRCSEQWTRVWLISLYNYISMEDHGRPRKTQLYNIIYHIMIHGHNYINYVTYIHSSIPFMHRFASEAGS